MIPGARLHSSSTAQPPTVRRRFTAAEWLITIGGSFFILALGVSAAFVPELRWLHLVQASIYAIAIYLSVRALKLGYFIGVSVAGFWNVLLMFGSPLFAMFIAEPTRPDVVLQVLAWCGNIAVVLGSAIGYRRLAVKSATDAGAFAVVFVVTTAFLVGATAILAPPYLSHLAGILHPHWPWTMS